jgi:U3 small nucleolar RNA-associated protein 22
VRVQSNNFLRQLRSHVLGKSINMAVTGNKRRKIDHVSSGAEEDDAASFASLSESGNAEDGEEVDDNEDQEMQDGSDGEDGDVDGEVPATKETKTTTASVKPTKQQLAATIGRQTGRDSAKDALASGASAFTSGTFKSNIFKMQVDELLEQLKPRHGKREKKAEEALHTLKKTIEQIPARAPQEIEQAERSLTKEKVAIPFPDPRPPKDAKYKLEYAVPSHINVVGSHALKTSNRVTGCSELDMVIQMPSSLFQDKDYLNHRFFYKRAYYLACLSAGLKKSHAQEFSIQFQEMHGNALNPSIVIAPKKASGEVKPAPKWKIHIVLAVAHDAFAVEKLALDKNCVRVVDPAAGANSPTPFYNSTIRSNMLVTQYLKLQHKAATSCSAYRDACLLGSSWLRQRGFGSNVATGGFGNFEWSALMAAMLSGGGPGGKPILSGGYSSYQLLKATLQLLAIKDLSRQPFMIGSANASSIPTLEDGSPVVWDEARQHNVLYKMTPWSYKLLQSAAKTTLAMLADPKFDGFESTFILRTDNTMMRFDVSLELDQAILAKADSKTSDIQQSLRKLYQTLQRGLGDRVTLINIRQPASGTWDVGTARPNQHSKGSVTVGIVINPENVNRLVDHGPSAENKADAAAFRKFWGEKAELRRFKDGSILESLIWSSGEVGQSVLEQITRYLLQRHFNSAVEQSAKFAGDEYSRMIRNSNSIEPFQPLMEAYKKLERDLRNLDDVPLTIRQLMPADAQLRFASIDAPMAGRASQQSKPADVTMQFEGSNRWPDDLVAIQRTKIAFLLKFGELLEESVEGLTTRVGLENEDTDVFNQGFLDVTYESGAAFRLRIHHEREQSFLERQLRDKSVDPKTRELAAMALAKYKCDSLKSPSHTQAIAQLCNRFPALSGTMRLTKKWFASHLLSNHIAEEVIELLVARTFVQPWPWTAPSSVQTGFLRTLFWISRWDWRADPLIVDLSGTGELKQSEMPSLNRVAVFAASNEDQDGVSWTDGNPSKVAAGRLTALARAAIIALEQQKVDLESASLFVSPVTDFDFVLHLSATATGRKRKSSKAAPAFKNLELDTLNDSSLAGYDAVDSLLSELDVLYGSAILFFANGTDKPVIAGLWNPQTAPRSWKVNLSYSTVPVKTAEEDQVSAEINKDAILAEIARLGGDLISKIEVNR